MLEHSIAMLEPSIVLDQGITAQMDMSSCIVRFTATQRASSKGKRIFAQQKIARVIRLEVDQVQMKKPLCARIATEWNNFI